MSEALPEVDGNSSVASQDDVSRVPEHVREPASGEWKNGPPALTPVDILNASEDWRIRAEASEARVAALEGENARLTALLNTPELHDFSQAVVLEGAHQRERWGSTHDAGKAPEDWFWLVGYLAGKALHAAKSGDADKALHHTISTGAALANWHTALSGADNSMRPGIDPVARGIEARAALQQEARR